MRGLNHEIELESFLKQGALLGIRDGKILIGWGEFNQTSSPHPIYPSFYSNDFFLTSDKPWYTFKNNGVFSPSDLLEWLPQKSRESRESREWGFNLEWSEPDWNLFSEMFFKVKEDISKGLLEKAVPCVRISSSFSPSISGLARLLRSIIKLPKDLIPYGMWNPKGGFLGASPELLFDLLGQRIHSGALAGTLRNFDNAHDLAKDPKEMWEHKIVVDYLVDQFSRIGTVSLGSPSLTSFGNISHLLTSISTVLRSPVDFSFLVGLLHPTPALGVYPKQGWKDKLKTLGHCIPIGDIYASPFGACMPMNFSRCVVSIRGVYWDRASITCVAGGGIVSQSRLENEIEEVRHKLHCILDNLGLNR